MPEVIHILLGEKDHPLLELLQQWVRRHAGTNGILKDKERFDFSDKSFDIPIFPADDSLVELSVLEVYNHLKRHHFESGQRYTIPLEHAEVCARILFRVVLARDYLGCNSLHDGEVYNLSRTLSSNEFDATPIGDIALRGRLRFIPSVHERAFNASLVTLSDRE